MGEGGGWGAPRTATIFYSAKVCEVCPSKHVGNFMISANDVTIKHVVFRNYLALLMKVKYDPMHVVLDKEIRVMRHLSFSLRLFQLFDKS